MPTRFAESRSPHSFFRCCGCMLLMAALLAGSVWPCQGMVGRSHKKDAKRQIEDLELQWRDAQLTGNALEMDKLLSEDYFGISMTGQVNTKAQQLERMRKRRLMLSRIDLSDVKVKLIGPTAIVTSRAEVEGMNDGQPMRGSFRYTRVYQRTAAGQWKITNFEATRLAQPPDRGVGDGGDGRP